MLQPGARIRASVSVPLLLVIAVAVLAVRAVAIAEPLGIDQSLWASAVRAMDHGQRLYRDVWEQRPPGIYLTYLAGFRLLGWTPGTLAWLDLFASAATAALLYATVRTLATSTAAAATTAIYATMTMPAWLYGYSGFLERSVCETFIVPCVAGAALAAARAWRRPGMATAAAAIIGFLVGTAVVFKPNAGLYLPALLAWLACFVRTPSARRPGPTYARWVAAAAAAAIVPCALAFLWIWQQGTLNDARVAIIDFNRFYVAEGATPAIVIVGFAKAVWLRIKTEPLWLGGAMGAVVAMWELARRQRLTPLAALAVLWGGAAAAVILVNGVRLFNSYFINALAPLAVMTAWLLTDVLNRPGRRVLQLAGLAMLAWLLVERGYAGRVMDSASADLRRLTGQTSEEDYLHAFGGYDNRRGYSARANEELAAYVRANTSPDDRIFLFGINAAGVYFLADRLPAHRFLRVNFFYPETFPHPAFTLEAVTGELARARPRLVIFERLNSPSDWARTVDAMEQRPEVRQLLDAYTLEARIEDFTIYRLGTDTSAPSAAP